MSDYATLKSDVADELARGDLTAQMDRFQRQTTQRINRDVRVSDMERRARAFGNNTRYLPCPQGFLEMRRLWNVIATSNKRPIIEQVAPQHLRHKTSGGALPAYFCIHRNATPEIEFDAVASTQYQFEMVYLRTYDQLVDDADTNWLLQNAYDLYFQAMLYAAERYLRNDERAAVRAADYTLALQETNNSERRQTYAQPMAAQSVNPVF